MASKSKKNCQGKDTFERMHFLYQAATELAEKNLILAQHYGNQCKTISRKSLQRMEPDMKRTICKRCGTVLITNVSSQLNVVIEMNGKQKVCEIECKNCEFAKRFVIKKTYNLWLDKESAVKEIIQPDSNA